MTPGLKWCLKRSPRGTRQNLVVSMPCTYTGRLCGCGPCISSQFSGSLMDILTLKTPQTQTDQGSGSTRPEVETKSSSPSGEVWPAVEGTSGAPSSGAQEATEERSDAPLNESQVAKLDAPSGEAQVTDKERSGAPLDQSQVARLDAHLGKAQVTSEERSVLPSDETQITVEPRSDAPSFEVQPSIELNCDTPLKETLITRETQSLDKNQPTVERTDMKVGESLYENPPTIETPIEFVDHLVEYKPAVETSRTKLDLDPCESGEGSNIAACQDAIAGSSKQTIAIATVEKKKRLSGSAKKKLRKEQRRLALLMESEKNDDSSMNVSSQIPNEQNLNSKSKLNISTTSNSQFIAKKRWERDFCPRPNNSGSVIKMAIVKDSFPSGKLNKEEVDTIQMEVLKKIDMTPASDHLPRILNSNLSAGAMIFICDDAETVEWLKITFNDNSDVISGTSLKVKSANEVLRSVKVLFKTKDLVSKDAGDLLRRLNRFNPEFKSNKWRVLNRVEGPFSVRWFFIVDLESAEAIKKAQFGGYTGLDWGVFKILKGPGTVDSTANAVPSSPQISSFPSSTTMSRPMLRNSSDSTGNFQIPSGFTVKSKIFSFPGSPLPSKRPHNFAGPAKKKSGPSSSESRNSSFHGSKESRNNSYDGSTEPRKSSYLGSTKPRQTSASTFDTDYRLGQISSPGSPTTSPKPWPRPTSPVFGDMSLAHGKKRPLPVSVHDSTEPPQGSSRNSPGYISSRRPTRPYQTFSSAVNAGHRSRQSSPSGSALASERSQRRSSHSASAYSKPWPHHTSKDPRRNPFHNSTDLSHSSSRSTTEPHTSSSRWSTEHRPSSSKRSTRPSQSSGSAVDAEHLPRDTSSFGSILPREPFNSLRRPGSLTSTKAWPDKSSAQGTQCRQLPSNRISDPRQIPSNRASEPQQYSSNGASEPRNFSTLPFQSTARRVSFRGSTRPRQTSSVPPDSWDPCSSADQWPSLTSGSAFPSDPWSYYFTGSTTFPPHHYLCHNMSNVPEYTPSETPSLVRQRPQNISSSNTVPSAETSPCVSPPPDPDEPWPDQSNDYYG